MTYKLIYSKLGNPIRLVSRGIDLVP